jgi:hypothetical protein
MLWMRTVVATPASWTLEEGAEGRRVLRAPSPGDLGVWLYPLWQLPDPPSAQVAPFVERDAPAGARARVVTQTEGQTRLGAPMTVIEAELVDAAGKPVERRLCAVYQFLEYGGGAMARSRDAATLAGRREELLALVATARADFSGPIAALEQLYQGLTEEKSWARS